MYQLFAEATQPNAGIWCGNSVADPSRRDSEFRHAAWRRCGYSARRFVAARIGRRLVGSASVPGRPCLHDITPRLWHSVLSNSFAGVSPVRHRVVDETGWGIVWNMRPTKRHALKGIGSLLAPDHLTVARFEVGCYVGGIPVSPDGKQLHSLFADSPHRILGHTSAGRSGMPPNRTPLLAQASLFPRFRSCDLSSSTEIVDPMPQAVKQG